MTKILPDIPRIRAHWERRSDKVPYLVVPMSDGSKIRYYPEIEHPGFVAAMDNIKHMAVGYQWKGEENNETDL